jgi:hypothetical protein
LGPSKEAAVATTERTERVVEVGLVHLDPLEEYPSE